MAVIATFLFGWFKNSEVKTGSPEVTLGYFYNTSQGYKPDVEARVYLFKGYDNDYENSYASFATGGLHLKGREQIILADFNAKADVSGKAVINYIHYMKYLLVASSKVRFVCSKKVIDLNSELKTETKNFINKYKFKDEGEPW